MINSILITNHLGESIELELRFPEKSGFLIESIDGLAPPKANINSTELATKDGSQYNSARVGERNIVIKLKYLPYPTVEDTRQKSYKYFPIKKRVDIRITSDNRICDTHGYIEANDIDIFSKEVSSQISIICPNPYFYDSVIAHDILGGYTPMFEFPLVNESLTENLLKVSDVEFSNMINVQYNGDVETGMLINIHMLGPATDIILYNYHTLDLMTFNTDWFDTLTPIGLIAGDDIFISTVQGEKYVRFLRDGVYYNVLNILDKDSIWLTLVKGENIIGYTATTGETNLVISIEHKTLYEGV